jgi:hypothetical protein
MIEIIDEEYTKLDLKDLIMTCFCRDCRQHRIEKLKTIYIQILFRNSLVNPYTRLGINKIFDNYLEFN